MKAFSGVSKKFIVMTALVCFAALGFTASRGRDGINIYFQMGGLEKKYLFQRYSGEDTAAFRGDTITVGKRELELLTAKKKLATIPNAEAKSVEYLLTREALYILAVKNNCLVDDSEAYETIQIMKDAYARDDSIGKEYVTAHIQGTGLSSDEYWDSQFDLYKKDRTIGAYTFTLREDYTASNGIAEFTPEAEAEWQQYLSQVANDYILQDNLKDYRR